MLLVVVGLEPAVAPHDEYGLRLFELCVSEAHLRGAGLNLVFLLVVMLDLLEHDVLCLLDLHLVLELPLLLAEIPDTLLVLDPDWPLRYHVLEFPNLGLEYLKLPPVVFVDGCEIGHKLVPDFEDDLQPIVFGEAQASVLMVEMVDFALLRLKLVLEVFLVFDQLAALANLLVNNHP